MPEATLSQMERARAARALLKDANKFDRPDQKEAEMAAFMAIFHPGREVPKLEGEERHSHA